ncbi:calcium uptake protein 3, mitochondrial-like isoform X3 [Carassius auratus]|uniref:Calcium uptake protein 3, mitochondrial-like isoform X2 n=1 Tax=Carassius auratus TaxID=7957 RepID=A0A6P6QTM9_CARAU|nr:calcium uptake protein 3, mitochondrial-like isoform X2 [Carassius auratus]XP_026136834.1 calcium uptake protein 3, mitochondrial-like isoform X3 [Carassius auratus]XP_052429520.1 calcium uptake protein 3, mitochondrial isoform X3 [Carassius gibelio]
MMAAMRRFLALRNKFTSSTNGLSLYFNSRQSWRERAVIAGTGLCITVGGFAVVYYQHNASLRALISPLPTVAAEEKASASAENEEVSMSAHEHRFRLFSSLEYDGQLYMTPLDFIESITMSEPKKKRFWRSLTKQDLDKILSDTPPVWKGSSRLFRNLRERGVIAYTEYLFLLCILTKPHAGFKIAFNMFDADGNEMVDKREFMVLEEIFRKKNEKKIERGGDPDSYSQLSVELYGHQGSVSSDHEPENVTDTTLLVHFFGRKGKSELNFDDFYRFMDNLQTEVLEIEFVGYSKGMTTISEEDFARILLRYTTVENITGYLENVRQSIPDEKGITFEEFRTFFQFLNNLEDFTIAMQMYNYANRPIGQDEFARAVYVATGLKLTRHLVNTVFKIFDVDHDDQLSYKEFIGIMKDRLHRGSWGYKGEERFTSFKACMRKELTAK